jgi:kynurenine formamidase
VAVDGDVRTTGSPDEVIALHDLLAGAPTNWGRWGPDDEVGALNFLTAEEVRAGAAMVRRGTVFPLAQPVATPQGDPVLPGRTPPRRLAVVDHSHFEHGKRDRLPGGLEWVDDYLTAFLQFGTHCDALGHMWFDDTLWNGFPAGSTVGAMARASIAPIGARGVAGRAVLVDIARYRGVESLTRDDGIVLDELLAAADAQGVTITPHTILLIRTGWMARLVSGAEPILDGFREPGLRYSPELVSWFHRTEIPCLVTDTLGNECTVDRDTGVMYPLHAALMRNLGVLFTEAAWLERLADDCAADGCYQFLYTAAPLPVSGGSGAPVNPVVIK